MPRLALLAAVLLTPPLLAQPSPPAPDSADLFRPEVLGAFLDSLFRAELAYGAPGAVVAVVKDGRVVALKGYGYADLRTRRPVDPARTVFRVGSVSKPVTATLALHLAERGRLDLDADVNGYLRDVRVPEAFGRPVTAAHLLTHTAGLDTRLNGTNAATAEGILPLSRYLARDLPPRVHAPGVTMRYSNHGTTLLGHVIEAASGEPFETYAARHLFGPLGMTRTAFRMTPELARDAATGYEPTRRGPRRAASLHPHITPAAGLVTTGADMARFMAMHLEGGAGVLRPETVEEMHRVRFRMDTAMPGLAYGFFEHRESGRRALLHSGGIRGFMSLVALWPEERVGLFVSNNGYDGTFIYEVYTAFARRAFPSVPPPYPPPPAGSRARTKAIEGVYRLANHPRRNLEKSGALRRGDLLVRVGRDGTLRLFGGRFVEVSPYHWRSVRSDERVAFRTVDGRMQLLSTDPVGGNQAWERLRWWEGPSLHGPLVFLFLAAFLAAPFVRPRPPRGGVLSAQPVPAGARQAWRVLAAVALLDLVFVWGLVLAFRASRDVGLLLGVPAGMRAALWLGAAASIAALALPFFAVRSWRRGYGTPAWRILYSLLSVVILGFVAFLHYWNLLGVRT